MMDRILGDEELAKKSGLSDEQITTIKSELNALKERSIELRAQLELAGMEQAEIIASDEVDEAALMAAVEKTGKINTEMAKVRIKRLLVMKKNISPEQLAKIREMVHERMRAHFRERREGGWGGRRDNSSNRRSRPPQRHGGDENRRPPQPPPGEEDRL